MVQKKTTPTERLKTVLLVTRDEARERISTQIEKGNELLAIDIRDQDDFNQAKARYKIWWDFTKELLRQIFSTTDIADEFSRSLGFAFLNTRPLTLQEKIGDYQNDLRRDLKRLISIRERLELFPLSVGHQIQIDQPIETGEQKVVYLCRRFHIFAQQLKTRERGRPPITIEDEYDVQYLLLALLRIYFDDVRKEVWTPNYAGGSSRMDFLLKPEKIVVEAKKTRDTLCRDNQIGDQLIVDIERYAQYPDCQTLICFVYDPDFLLDNPRGLERDLSGPREKINVIVVVSSSNA